MTKNNKRRHYFIKKKFQADFILRFCMILFAGSVISGLLLFLFSKNTLTSIYSDSGLQIISTGKAILPAIVLTSLITWAGICLCSVLVLLFVSHKIAGPLFRFEKDIDRLSAGDLGVRITLRQKDQFKEMARSINQMAASFYLKIESLDRSLEEIQTLQTRGKPIDQLVDRTRTRLRENFKLNKTE